MDSEKLKHYITQEKGTEVPFSGKLLHNKEKGIYTCSTCQAELFDSHTKFDSGTGWPSFYDIKKSDAIELKKDESLGMKRVEVVCKKCGAHLGPLFDDGPKINAQGHPATGKRYCINSISLDFKKEK